jgi:hypothetical protein
MLLLALPAGASSRLITFRTVPPATEAYDEMRGHYRLQADGLSAFRVDLPDSSAILTLNLRCPGHSGTFKVDANELRNTDVYPPDTDPLKLAPDSNWVALGDFLRSGPGVLAGLALLVGIGAAAVWATKARRSERTARLEQQRAEMTSQELQTAHEDNARLAAMNFEGMEIEGFRIGRKLGQGGMGFVHLAEPADGGAPCAIKIILRSDEEENTKRALREIDTMARLSHPGLIRLFSHGETTMFFYIVMELVPGGTLGDRIKPGGLPIADAIRSMQDIATAVHYAHQKGFIHRDLKPGNVMFTNADQVKVMDFGLARKQHVSTKVTRTGTILGTPPYMAPEQIRAEPLTAAVDQYALGCVLFEMLTGQLPFDGDIMDILQRAMYDAPIPPSAFNPAVPPHLDMMVLRMLAKTPTERYPDLQAVVDALEA